MEQGLTHINENGEAVMVDVGLKEISRREAVAESTVLMQKETLELILGGAIRKGDVFAAARIAGMMAAKRTHELIPMCHPLPIDSVSVDIKPVEPDAVRIVATVVCTYRTGVEMEALTAASIAALTIYDMCKAVDRGMEIVSTRLVKKSGGKSGVYQRI